MNRLFLKELFCECFKNLAGTLGTQQLSGLNSKPAKVELILRFAILRQNLLISSR